MPDLPFQLNDRLGDARNTLRDKVRFTFSAAGIWTITKTLLWLAPLTILIWFTAESSRYTTEEFTFKIQVVAADQSKSVTLLRPQSEEITFSVYGKPLQIEQFSDLDASKRPIVLVLTDTGSSGRSVRPVTPLLLSSEPFRRAGVSGVRNVSPGDIEVSVDTIKEMDVPVIAPKGPNAIANLHAAVFDPPIARIRGPADVLKAAEEKGELAVEADLAGLEILRSPGKKEPLKATLRWRGGGEVTILPATVEATLEIRESDVEYAVASMPIFASLPATFADNFRLTIAPDFVPNVRILGPEEQISLVRDNKFLPKARLDFLDSEINDLRGNRTVMKRPSFELPDRVRVDKADLDRIIIECKATPRGGS